MVVEWTPEEASLLQDRPFSAAACLCHSHYSTAALYETLHDRPFSVKSEESLRDSEPPDIFTLGTRAPRDMRSECIKLVSFTLISHIVPCMLH